ncbi:MAG: hypothetical protein IT366_14445 [Candidatus Hydrogenedentes bacterium]|nr:hypothetical protein [Candidatus Hydrogenedentota bacterium]
MDWRTHITLFEDADTACLVFRSTGLPVGDVLHSASQSNPPSIGSITPDDLQASLSLAAELIASAAYFPHIRQAALQFDEGEEEQAVRACFENYRSAVNESDGATATSIVSANTLKRYDENANHAKHSDRATIQLLPLIDQLTILMSRCKISASELANISGGGLFATAVSAGWVSKNALYGLNLGRIEIKGTRAEAEGIINGRVTPAPQVFVFEDEDWKYDLVATFDTIEDALSQLAARNELSAQELVFSMIESNLGEAPSESIWNPPHPH